MTRDKPPLRIGGRAVAPQLRAAVPPLTRRVVARLLSELPVYAELPPEEVAGDIDRIVQDSLRAFADVIDRRRLPGPDGLAAQRESAAQRAEEGVPLDAILTAYQIGTTMCWEEIAARSAPADHDDLCELMLLLLGLQRELIATVSGAYLEARQILDSQEHGGRHALLSALVAGDRLDRFTEPRPAAWYIVLTLAFARHADEADRGRRGGVAARRKIHRVRAALDAFAGEPSLTALDATGGTALLPVVTPPPWDELCKLVDGAAESAGIEVTAAAAVSDPAGIPAAVDQTAQIVQIARAGARPPGLYRLADVLLDYQLSRPGDALPELAALLDPVDGKPDLLRTLQEYLHRDLDRRGTAAALHIHPNTLAYRIRRVTELTGLSPARPSDLQLIQAALVARRCGPGR